MYVQKKYKKPRVAEIEVPCSTATEDRAIYSENSEDCEHQTKASDLNCRVGESLSAPGQRKANKNMMNRDVLGGPAVKNPPAKGFNPWPWS